MNIDIKANKMKSKQLRALIREAITEVLSEATLPTTIDYKDKNRADKVLDLDPSDVATINKLKQDSNITSISMGTKKIKEGDIEEMARRAKGYELVDPEIDPQDYVRRLVSGVSLADIINYFKENPGAEKTDIQQHFGFVRPQIANAIINGLVDAGVLTKSGTLPPEEGEETTPSENEPISIDAEDYFIGNKMSVGLGTILQQRNEPEPEELDFPEEPEIPELPIDGVVSLNKVEDKDYNAWIEYAKYRDRLSQTKSNLIQIRKQRKRGDDISQNNTEEERLLTLKSSLEQRMNSIINTNDYIKTKLGSEKELNEDILKRFRTLANISHG